MTAVKREENRLYIDGQVIFGMLRCWSIFAFITSKLTFILNLILAVYFRMEKLFQEKLVHFFRIVVCQVLHNSSLVEPILRNGIASRKKTSIFRLYISVLLEIKMI